MQIRSCKNKCNLFLAITRNTFLLTFACGVSVLSPPMKQNNESFPFGLNTWKNNPMTLFYPLSQLILHYVEKLMANTTKRRSLGFLLNIIFKKEEVLRFGLEESSIHFHKSWGKQCLWPQYLETSVEEQCQTQIWRRTWRSRVTQSLVFSFSKLGQAISTSLKQRSVKIAAALQVKFKLTVCLLNF